MGSMRERLAFAGLYVVWATTLTCVSADGGMGFYLPAATAWSWGWGGWAYELASGYFVCYVWPLLYIGALMVANAAMKRACGAQEWTVMVVHGIGILVVAPVVMDLGVCVTLGDWMLEGLSLAGGLVFVRLDFLLAAAGSREAPRRARRARHYRTGGGANEAKRVGNVVSDALSGCLRLLLGATPFRRVARIRGSG